MDRSSEKDHQLKLALFTLTDRLWKHRLLPASDDPLSRGFEPFQSFAFVGDKSGSSLLGTAKSSLLTGAVSSASESVGELTSVVLECLAVAATLGLSIFTRADARDWSGTGLMRVVVPAVTGWLWAY